LLDETAGELLRSGVRPDANFASKRVNQLDGEEAGFLGQGLGAGPVAGFACFVGLGEEAADFFLQILLGGVEDFAVGLL